MGEDKAKGKGKRGSEKKRMGRPDADLNTKKQGVGTSGKGGKLAGVIVETIYRKRT